MSFVAWLLNREPRKEGMLGMDRRRNVVLRLVRAWGRRWWNAAAGGMRKVAVVMFVRVNVRMRVGRVGKRM